MFGNIIWLNNDSETLQKLVNNSQLRVNIYDILHYFKTLFAMLKQMLL